MCRLIVSNALERSMITQPNLVLLLIKFIKLFLLLLSFVFQFAIILRRDCGVFWCFLEPVKNRENFGSMYLLSWWFINFSNTLKKFEYTDASVILLIFSIILMAWSCLSIFEIVREHFFYKIFVHYFGKLWIVNINGFFKNSYRVVIRHTSFICW